MLQMTNSAYFSSRFLPQIRIILSPQNTKTTEDLLNQTRLILEPILLD